jgi:hypothetical protein
MTYGDTQRYMDVPERKEEVVAAAHGDHAISHRHPDFYQRVRNRPVYLHPLLR